MYTRRTFFVSAAAFSVTGAIAARAQDACSVVSADRQKATTPAAALQILKDGNTRFVAGKTVNCDLRAQVKATATGQYPIAAIVGCIDSRVPPELVFDQRLGDIFAARIAGNFINTDIIGSLEFAAKVAGAKVIVVLGHSECGAVKGAVDNVKLGNLTTMLENISPAASAVQSVEGERNSKNKKYVQAVAEKNAELAARQLLEKSEILRDLVAAGQLQIVWAMHDIATGKVSFSA